MTTTIASPLPPDAERKLAEAFKKILERRYPNVRWNVERAVVTLRERTDG